MRTMNIFKTLALAMLMPTMLLTTACSSEDDLVNNTAGESTANTKGYALPVTVNVTRQGDEPTHRASYNGETKKLSFSAGDKLFVAGDHADAGSFAGVLDYDDVSGKFSGTVTTLEEYPGTAEELLSSATDAEALLIPAGYKSYEYFELEDEITPYAGYFCEKTNAFALTKAAAVEQFSFELAETYSSGFTLSPQNAIVSFTISGLTANKEVAVSFDTYMCGVISKSVTTSAEGVATFAIGLDADIPLENCTLTVDGNNIAMPTKTTEAGHIYNISRSVVPAPAYTLLSTISSDYTAQDGETLTGTLGSNVKISIADGAKVTLKGVTINGVNNTSYKWAGITCEGNATITLEGMNTLKGFDQDYPGIYVPQNKTLTIEGEGSLKATSNGDAPGIGAGADKSCGNIVINGGNITATGNGNHASGIGGGENAHAGNITINGGIVTATGADRAAGIGGGGSADVGNITITGGTVTATGGYRGAGIGGSMDRGFGNILISGGTVTAKGGEDAAGIGGGRYNGRYASCGTITIKSTVTKVTATKGSSSAQSIGKGNKGSGIFVTIEAGANVTQN